MFNILLDITGLQIFALISLLLILFYISLIPAPIPGIPSTNPRTPLGDIPKIYPIATFVSLFYAKKRNRGLSRTKTLVELSYQFSGGAKLFQVLIGPAGSILSGSWFGKRWVIVNDPNLVTEICQKRSNEFPDPGLGLDVYRGVIPNGQLALRTDKVFKQHRRAIGPSMTSSYLAKITPKITHSVTELIQLWKLRCKALDQTGEVSFKQAAQDLRLSTMDTISEIIFGESFGVTAARIQHLEEREEKLNTADDRPEFPRLAHGLNLIVRDVAVAFVWPYPKIFWFFRSIFNRFEPFRRSIFKFLDKAVESARASGGRAGSIVDLLVTDQLEARRRGEPALNDAEIREELLVYWVAGHGTMACTLSWAVKLLARSPEVQKRLRLELISILPGPEERSPTYADLVRASAELDYLDAVVHEILRCARTLADVSRETRRPVMLAGALLPPHTTVVMPHGYWGDRSFDPEKWLDADGRFDFQRPGPFHAFGHGPRGCFGKNLALLELRLYVAMLSMEFFFDRVPEDMDSMEAMELVAHHPVTCLVRPRLWSEIDIQ